VEGALPQTYSELVLSQTRVAVAQTNRVLKNDALRGEFARGVIGTTIKFVLLLSLTCCLIGISCVMVTSLYWRPAHVYPQVFSQNITGICCECGQVLFGAILIARQRGVGSATRKGGTLGVSQMFSVHGEVTKAT
jgi:hypothetical protein